MGLLSGVKKELKRKITIMFIPHGKFKPLKLNISMLFLCVFMFSWTSLTLWSGYLVSKHIDYVKTKADNKIMQIRLLFFADQLQRTKNMFEKIQINDDKIRSLLSLSSQKSIIEENTGENLGEGGPTQAQANAFSTILSGTINKIDASVLSKHTSQISEQFQLMQKSYSEIMSNIHQQRLLYMATPTGWPCEGIISSPYGFRFNPFFQTTDFHSGLDIANGRNTPVYATANGRVVFSGWQSGYGNIVVIDHGHNYITEYGHLEKRLVQVGDYINRGQLIARMGSSGSATGTHLHYEIHYKGKSVNPVPYLSDYFYTQYERNKYDQKKFKKFA